MQVSRQDDKDAFFPSPNHMTKNNSNNSHRQKLPAFKPKKLTEICLNKCKKSSDSFPLLNSQDSKQSNTKYETQQNPGLKLSKSLDDFIKQSGHQYQIQSEQFQNSEADKQIIDIEQFNLNGEQTRKKQYQVSTPQISSFSKTSAKDIDPFKCKDDSFLSPSSHQNKKYWNGKITLSTSICYDQISDQQENQQVEVPAQLRPFLDQRRYYIQCINIINSNEYLFQSSQKVQYSTIQKQLLSLQKKSRRRKQKIRVKFIAKIQNEEQAIYQQFSKIQNTVISTKQFSQLLYSIESQVQVH